MSTPDDPNLPPSSEPGYGAEGGPPPEGGLPAQGAVPPRKGLSTGAKVAIGCGGILLLGMVLIVALIGVGGLFLKDRADRFVAGVERQGEVSERMEQLRRDHPFEPPADGAVSERQARTFFTVTDAAWDDIEPWASEMEELSRRMESGERGRLSDIATGVRGMGRFVESRAVLADALVEHGMSVGEYLWTGLALLRARDELDRSDPSEQVPAQNLALAREHRAELEEIASSRDDRPGKGVVLHVATVWGMADGSTWQAFGLDTLQRYAR